MTTNNTNNTMKIDNLVNPIHDPSISQLNTEINRLRGVLYERNDEMESNELLLAQLGESNRTLQVTVETLRGQYDAAHKANVELRSELAGTKEELANTKKELAGTKEELALVRSYAEGYLKDLQEQLNAKEEQLKAKEELMLKLCDSAFQSDAKAQRAQEEMQHLHAHVNDLTQQNQDLRAKLAHARREIAAVDEYVSLSATSSRLALEYQRCKNVEKDEEICKMLDDHFKTACDLDEKLQEARNLHLQVAEVTEENEMLRTSQASAVAASTADSNMCEDMRRQLEEFKASSQKAELDKIRDSALKVEEKNADLKRTIRQLEAEVATLKHKARIDNIALGREKMAHMTATLKLQAFGDQELSDRQKDVLIAKLRKKVARLDPQVFALKKSREDIQGFCAQDVEEARKKEASAKELSAYHQQLALEAQQKRRDAEAELAIARNDLSSKDTRIRILEEQVQVCNDRLNIVQSVVQKRSASLSSSSSSSSVVVQKRSASLQLSSSSSSSSKGKRVTFNEKKLVSYDDDVREKKKCNDVAPVPTMQDLNLFMQVPFKKRRVLY